MGAKSCALSPSSRDIEMSRVAKMPISVPAGLDISLGSGEVRVKGPRGELSLCVHPSVEVRHENGTVTCRPRNDADGSLAQVGTARSLIANMVKGVSVGFEKELQLVGCWLSGASAGNDVGAVAGIFAPD